MNACVYDYLRINNLKLKQIFTELKLNQKEIFFLFVISVFCFEVTIIS